MSTELTMQLLEFISDKFDVSVEEIDTTTSLVDQGVVDSFGLVEIATFLEKSCSVRIGNEMITVDNFGSIEKMSAFAESLPKA